MSSFDLFVILAGGHSFSWMILILQIQVKFLNRWTISWLRELSDDFVTIDINTFYCSRAMTLLFSSLRLLAAAPITSAWMTVNCIYTIRQISPKLQTIKLINLSKEKWLHLIHYYFVTWRGPPPVRRILIHQCKRRVGLGYSERNNAPYSRGLHNQTH